MRQPRRKGSTNPHSLSEQLRTIIRSRGLSAYKLGRDAKVDRSIVTRFLNREGSLSLESLDQIAAALRLRLVEVGGKAKAARRAASAPKDPPEDGDAPDPEP
jgi:transcriptional regulator with XRE-family HTH domain